MQNNREFLSEDIYSLLKILIDKEENEDYDKKYVGKVINNKDPEKLGRCRIKVFGIFDEIPNDDLPWAIPDFNFVGSTIGSFVVPPVNTIVSVYFDHGDVYLPHYSTKVIEKSKLSNKRLENYPDTMILFETDEGDYLTMNRKTKKFVFHHNSGNEVSINNKGDTDILVKGNKDQKVLKDETHTVLGDHVIKNGNIAEIKIDKIGNINIKGGIVTIDHTIMTRITHPGTAVIPIGSGPLNALPTDPITGIPHSGIDCI